MEPIEKDHRTRKGTEASRSHHKNQATKPYRKRHDDKMRKRNSEYKEKQRKQWSKEKREKRKERIMNNRDRNTEWRNDVNYYHYFGFLHKNKSYLMFPIKTKFFGLFLTKQSKLFLDRLIKQNKDVFSKIYDKHPDLSLPLSITDKYKNDFIKDLMKFRKHMIDRKKLMSLIKNSRSQEIPQYGFIDNPFHVDELRKKSKKKYDKLFILNLNINKLTKLNYKYNLVLDYRNIEYILCYDYSIYNYREIDRNFGFQDHKNRKITVNIPDVKPAYYFYKWKHNNSLPDDESIRRSDYVFVYNTKHKGNTLREEDKEPNEE